MTDLTSKDETSNMEVEGITIEVETEPTTTSGIGVSESGKSETSKIGLSLREKIKDVPEDEVWKVVLDEYFIIMPEISAEEKLTIEELSPLINLYYERCQMLMDKELMCDLVRKFRKAFKWNRTLQKHPGAIELACRTEFLLLEIEMCLNEKRIEGYGKTQSEKPSDKDAEKEMEVSSSDSPKSPTVETSASDVESHQEKCPSSKLEDLEKIATDLYSAQIYEESFEKLFMNEVHADMIKRSLVRHLMHLKIDYHFFDIKSSERSSHPLWKNINPSVYPKADYLFNALKFIRTLIQMLRASFMMLKRCSTTEAFKERLNAYKSEMSEVSASKEQTDVKMES
ncbi:uncharacterized protein TNCT_56681 [Trichonephila clavata]|uniref:Uncharacterized protein n=1 Tax=Trichonephila clavata TaxID=2740835 RepID=A0A8X6JEI7_TRICU|nr:uncharacterized protein TNCT_56681 [Trichonephila clavata]